ncbi:MAG: hypothetical protein HOG49_07155 [Candidatus Scalindua sp.]|jgi:hypothetical protein|nr:hypothetical protein [Candidatus Scalindua sp.]
MNSYDISDAYLRPQVHVNNSWFVASVRMLVLSLALLVYILLLIDLITNFQGMVIYTLLLLSYISVEIRNLWARDRYIFWINPVVLASILTFVLSFGVTNILYFLPENMLSLVGLSPIITVWMNQLMLLVILAAVSMWVGYASGLGRGLGSKLQRSRVLRKWVSPSFRVNKLALYIFLAISLIAKLWGIKLGVYGYSSTYDQLMVVASYTQYFYLAGLLGKLALVSAALQCFAASRHQRSSFVDKQVLWLVLGYEVAFGFLSGFKSAIVMPFIIVGLVYYSQHNRFPRWLIPTILAGLMTAYAVIEPFRVASNDKDSGFVGTSFSSIVSTMMSFSSVNVDDDVERASKVLQISTRMNMTYIGSLGIEYAANHSELPASSPKFLGDIILAPVHALIPRLLWPSKSLQNIGLWYTNQVRGFDFKSSTAMSPFTYLNFAGGPLAVILGFFMVGVLQRGLFDGLRHFGGGGLIIFFGLLGTLANIDSAFNGVFITLIRFFPLLVFAQYVLLQRPRR